MKVRFEHPDMAGERNDWCVDCNDEERKQNGMSILNGSLDIGSSEQGQVIGVVREGRGRYMSNSRRGRGPATTIWTPKNRPRADSIHRWYGVPLYLYWDTLHRG